jgi:branched-chain amino acid transport system substrate-binding protein
MPLHRRTFIAAISASLPAYLNTALAEDSNTQSAPASPAMPKIGALLPLSGPESLVGDECLRGIQLAVDAIDDYGGITQQPIVLLQGDALNQGQAEQAAKSLIGNGQVNLLLGTGSSKLAYPGSDAAELAQIPYIELNAPADGITSRNFKFLLRTSLTTSMMAAAAIGAINGRFAGKQIGLLFNTGATAGAVAAAALEQWQQQKIVPLISIGYPEDVADLHEPIGRMRRAGAEIILHAAGTDDVLVLFHAMQDNGWKPNAVIGCGDGYGLRETAFALGNSFDGTFIVAAPGYGPRAEYIATAYETRFGMPPRSASSLTSFVGAKLVLDILNSVNDDTTKLLDALRKTDIPNGTLANGWGTFFDKSGQNIRAFATLQQWRDGALVTLS